MAIKPYEFADGIYYRLGKKLEKKELGIILLSCKTLLNKFSEKKWQDFEIWAFADNLVYQMTKNQLPRTFRLFYVITENCLNANKYAETTEETNENYRDWINNEIERLKSS